MNKYILSCESTVDMPYSYMEGRNIPILFYHYMIDGQEYIDDMGKDPDTIPGFYARLEEGGLPSTSQINEFSYREYFSSLLEKGDVLHIALGTGMTNSAINALAAANDLKDEFPDRKLVVIDSLASSSGYGLLVDYAADMRDAGKSLEETAQWLESTKNRFHHHFFSTDMTFFRRSGRVSGTAAAVATILGICPVMRLNDKGAIIAYGKVRGKKAAIRHMVDQMLAHAEGGEHYSGKCFISNSNCPETAMKLKEELKKHFKEMSEDIRITEIGPIIGSHTGPGTVAFFFLGDERIP